MSLPKAARMTVAFLRMAAIELRDIADHEVGAANAIRDIADKCDADADELSRHLPKDE